MRTLPLSLLVVTALAAGCNRAKSPDAVAKDVVAAEQRASTELADSQNVATKDIYRIALAKADGDRRISLATCDALAGDAQKDCRDRANADYDAARANAKAAEVAQRQ